MTDNPAYLERVSSARTEALFVALTLLFFLLFAWRAEVAGVEIWSVLCLCFSAFFLFYSLNFRTLIIRLGGDALQLDFGVFAWTIPLRNLEACFPDTTSLWRVGGAGVHFTMLGGRYRAMLTFLEHPRLVVALRTRQGLVRDIAFSTRRPDELMRLIGEASRRNGAA